METQNQTEFNPYERVTENVPEINATVQNPFSISFYDTDREVKVTLKRKEDILKVGEMFSKWLTDNGIENVLETK